ncbi:MAG TPA: lysylphosphatidylglycerol synthase domain-containing protein, partial [Vicinamibacterales bacterium]|nr:lysylphosphatidylglycerol synthase domain-containing protein [Vicinamibacterales bacterium]
MKATRAIRIVIGVVAVALFVESLHVLGAARIAAGLTKLGWGFLAILAVAGARDLVRAIAWTLTVERPARLGLLPALRARLAGEALNTLLPMGVVVGEPTKASHVRDHLPFGAAARALAVEFAFYGASLVPLFAAGVAAFAMANRVAIGIATTLVAGVGIVVAASVMGQRMLRRVPALRANSPQRVAIIAGCEAAYQVLAVAEVYLTLALISPAPPTIASALVLESINRGVTMFFKMIPMRVGVDEASSSFVAPYVSLDPATGLTLALVRKLRMLVWSAVGL